MSGSIYHASQVRLILIPKRTVLLFHHPYNVWVVVFRFSLSLLTTIEEALCRNLQDVNTSQPRRFDILFGFQLPLS